jgi:hypothetical protein
MRYILTVFITGLFFLSGCSSSQNKPSPLDVYWNSKGNTIAYKKYTAPKKLAAGQYVVMGALDKGSREAVTRITIVRKEKNGWVYEAINTDRKGKTSGMQMLIDGIDKVKTKNDLDKLNIAWVKVLDTEGNVEMLDISMLAFTKKLYTSQLEQLVISNQVYEDGGPVTVPAGIFKGTVKVKSEGSFLQKAYIAFFHPDVPINGMVMSTDEKGNVMIELLDYGSNGKGTIE